MRMPGSQPSVCNFIRADFIPVVSEYCANYPDFEEEIREYCRILNMNSVSKGNIIKYLERGFAERGFAMVTSLCSAGAVLSAPWPRPGGSRRMAVHRSADRQLHRHVLSNS
jgi:hypothetical protein